MEMFRCMSEAPDMSFSVWNLLTPVICMYSQSQFIVCLDCDNLVMKPRFSKLVPLRNPRSTGRGTMWHHTAALAWLRACVRSVDTTMYLNASPVSCSPHEYRSSYCITDKSVNGDKKSLKFSPKSSKFALLFLWTWWFKGRTERF